MNIGYSHIYNVSFYPVSFKIFNKKYKNYFE